MSDIQETIDLNKPESEKILFTHMVNDTTILVSWKNSLNAYELLLSNQKEKQHFVFGGDPSIAKCVFDSVVALTTKNKCKNITFTCLLKKRTFGALFKKLR